MNEKSGAQVLLPATTEEDEHAILDRFVEGSKEIAPSLQVTLAKRFVQPGSNRIMCLAARTSVPLNDDQVASVSDLALQLSDGTNVVLSISVFNEFSGDFHPRFNRPVYQSGDTEIYEPLKSHYYEPSRYTFDSESKLGIFLAITAVLSSLAFYLIVSHSPTSNVYFYQTLQYLPFKAVPQTADAKNDFANAKTDSSSNSSSKRKSARASRHSSRTRSTAQTNQTAQASKPHASRSSMFVPPPPPVMVFDAPPANLWWPGLPSTGKPAAKTPDLKSIAKPAQKVPEGSGVKIMKVTQPALVAPVAPVAPTTPVSSSKQLDSDFSSRLPEPAIGTVPKSFYAPLPSDVDVLQAPAANEKTAPIPGVDP